MNTVLVLVIGFYQRFVSPYKGFCCAAHVYYGSGSCSQVVKQVIADQGLVPGRVEIRNQFRRCQFAAAAIRAEKKDSRGRRKKRDPRRPAIEGACWSCALLNWF